MASMASIATQISIKFQVLIKLNKNFLVLTSTQVAAGEVIGTVARSSCNNHIHLSMLKEARGYIDPTPYLEPRTPSIPTWTQECDDYKFIYKVNGTYIGIESKYINIEAKHVNIEEKYINIQAKYMH